jgi:hypothetical protein
MERIFHFEYTDNNGNQSTAEMTVFIGSNDESVARQEAEDIFDIKIAPKESIISFWEV